MFINWQRHSNIEQLMTTISLFLKVSDFHYIYLRNTQQNSYTKVSLLENLAHSSHIRDHIKSTTGIRLWRDTQCYHSTLLEIDLYPDLFYYLQNIPRPTSKNCCWYGCPSVCIFLCKAVYELRRKCACSRTRQVLKVMWSYLPLNTTPLYCMIPESHKRC